MVFSKILFPTDFSGYSDSVLACLPDLKSAGRHEVILFSPAMVATVLEACTPSESQNKK